MLLQTAKHAKSYAEVSAWIALDSRMFLRARTRVMSTQQAGLLSPSWVELHRSWLLYMTETSRLLNSLGRPFGI